MKMKERKLNFWKLVIIFSIIMLIGSRFGIAKISGNSMYPTLKDGDWVIIDVYALEEDEDIVVLDTSDTELGTDFIIKRYYEEKSESNKIWLEGDNKENSYDSRNYGLFDRNNIKGKAIFDITQFKSLNN